jgi:hypothetical protein
MGPARRNSGAGWGLRPPDRGGRATPGEGSRPDASAEGATTQPPAGLKQFSRDALLTLPYCNVAHGELSGDFKLEVQDDLSSALARVSFPLPTLLPDWVQCHYTGLMYDDQSQWSILVILRGRSTQVV